MHLSRVSSGIVMLAFAGSFAGCSTSMESADSNYRATAENPNSQVPPSDPQVPMFDPDAAAAAESDPKAEAEQDPGAFTATASDPFSTFAADVDTASYDLFRSRLMNSGALPDRAWVRTEEFVNYFDYDYAAPGSDDKHPFRIALAATTNFLDNPRAVLRVGIQAATPPESEKRPTNLAFLIDVSGSMQDAYKLPLVKKLLSETLEVLDPDDRVAVVTYAAGTSVALHSVPVSERSTIEAVIEDLSANGSTNGAGGIQLAYEEVHSEWIDGGINHVILCTDGDFNVGVSNTSELVDLIEKERKSGITFTAVGFGLDPNDAMLEEISNHGNGVYGVVGSAEDATKYAHERMLSTLTHVAKDMKIQVEFNPEFVWAYRLLGYENRAIADDDFRDDLVDAGEVGAGHRVTALYELALDPEQLPAGEEPSAGETSDLERSIDADDLVLVRVRYKDVGASEQDPAHEVKQGLSATSLDTPDRDLEWAGAVAQFAEILKGSPHASKALLPGIESVLEAQTGRDAERDEFIELFREARALLEAE